jgi:hypothetical protein
MINLLTKFRLDSVFATDDFSAVLSTSTSSEEQSERIEALQKLANQKTDIAMHTNNVRYLDQVLSKKCKKCHSLKPPLSHHCSICKRCIARMDHHCPWVNTCVGFYNQKFFLQFLVYVFLGSLHALVLIIIRGARCLDKNCMLFRDTSSMIIAGFSGFLALLFGLFVLVMFCDQI